MNQINKLKIGIIGAGRIVEATHLPILSQHPLFEVAWILDFNIENTRALIKKFKLKCHTYKNINDVSTDIDCLLLTTPVGARMEYWNFIRQYNIPTFVEKPLANTHENLLIIEKMIINGNVISVGLQRRYYNSTKAFKKIIESEIFGSIKSIYAGEGGEFRGYGIISSSYQSNVSLSGGGILIETGIHLIDQLFYILDIQSYNTVQINSIGYDGIDIDNHIQADLNLKNQSGIPSVINLSATRNIKSGIEIEFENCLVCLQGGIDDPLILKTNDGTVISSINSKEEVPQNGYEIYVYEWNDFAEKVMNKSMTALDAENCIVSQNFILDCYSIILN